MTFNDLPEAIEQMTDMIAVLSKQVSMLQRELSEIRGEMKSEPELILGRFRQGELIKMCDSRLWEGEGAPFKSKFQVQKSRDYGCPFFSASGKQSYRIEAEKLRDWLRGTTR